MIDDCVAWKYHISYICSQISRNIGIISKLRHNLSIKQLKQIYYNLIYPYIAYAILARGSTYISSLQNVQVKQNHVARLIFFANIRGKDTESALPLLSLLDMLPVYNIYSLHVLKNLPTSGTKVYYLMYFATPFSMLAKCIATILDMQRKKII